MKNLLESIETHLSVNLVTVVSLPLTDTTTWDAPSLQDTKTWVLGFTWNVLHVTLSLLTVWGSINCTCLISLSLGIESTDKGRPAEHERDAFQIAGLNSKCIERSFNNIPYVVEIVMELGTKTSEQKCSKLSICQINCNISIVQVTPKINGRVIFIKISKPDYVKLPSHLENVLT